MREREKRIFIILSDTGTWFTRLIRLYTKAPFNHASIALDPDFREVYSFGRKQPDNPFIGGFVQEDLGSELFQEATCAVYSCVVTYSQYMRIQAMLESFKRDADAYRYNLLGLIGILLNVRVERERAFFCSQFVAALFEQSGTRLVPKCPSLTTPADIGQSESLRLVYQGALSSIMREKEWAS